jgi:hypothetical protein
MEGFAYRIVPYASQDPMFGRGGINADAMYDNMVNKFKWGGINDPDVYLDENVVRMAGNFRSTFARLAFKLLNENKPDSARKALDKCMEVIPESAAPYSIYTTLLAEGYYRLGDTAKAAPIVEGIKKAAYQDLDYFISLGDKYYNNVSYEIQLAFYTFDELRRLAATYNLKDLQTEMDASIRKYAADLNIQL